LREFVGEGQPAVDRFLALAPPTPAAIDPALPVDQAIAQTRDDLLTMPVLRELRRSQVLTDAQWREVGNNQKALWRARIDRRLGNAAPGAAQPAFEFDDADVLNVFQLEAVVEAFLNYNDPWRPKIPVVAGANEPRAPGPPPYIIVNLLTGLHVVLIDSFGGRLRGSRAAAVGTLLRLDGPPDLRAVRPGTDSIRLDADDARASRTYQITALDAEEGILTLDAPPHLVGGVSSWQIDVAAGGRLRGDAASVRRDVVELDIAPADMANLDRLNPRFDTIYLPSDRANRTYRILRRAERRLMLDQPVDLDVGISSWHIGSGVSGELPALAYNLGPGGANGFDHFDGAMFIVHDGVVFLDVGDRPFRWSSYTSRRNAEPQHLSSVRGNHRYDFASFRSSDSAFRNYCFSVRDPGAAYDGVREARFYFGEVVTADVAVAPAVPNVLGKTLIRIHDAHANGGGTGSAGCLVSPRFYAFRDRVIERYQIEHQAAHGGAVDGPVQQVYGRNAAQSAALLNGDLVTFNQWTNRIRGTFWLVRPDERPLGSLVVTLLWPDSRPDVAGQPRFKGTPIQLPDDRLPYLHTDQPTSFQDTVTMASTPGAQHLRRGARPGEYEPDRSWVLNEGTDFFLIVPEHAFVRVTSDAAPNAWRRRVLWDSVEPRPRHTFGLRVRVDDEELRITPLGGAEQAFGGDIYIMSLVPSMPDASTADLTQPWHRAVRGMRADIGEYPPFREAQLPFHQALDEAVLPDVEREHRAPEELIRFLSRSEKTFTDLTDDVYLEQFLWDESTLTGQRAPQRVRYLPLPKRAFLDGIRALRRLPGNAKLDVVTGFVPPNRVQDALQLRTVGGISGYRINQIRHIFGDAADLDRIGVSLDTAPNRRRVVDAFLPWPDTGAGTALRGEFNLVQFQRVMRNTAPAVVSRNYVLHVEKSDYDLPFHTGVYQFTLGDLTAAGGHTTIADNLRTGQTRFVDVVVSFAQAPPRRPKAGYPSQLNAQPPHGHAVFDTIEANPNLEALFGRLDADDRAATLHLQLRQVGHDEDVDAVVREVVMTYTQHTSLLGVQIDLEAHDASVNATSVLQQLAEWLSQSGDRVLLLCPVWHDVSAAKVDWATLAPLTNVVPVYDGAPKQLWGVQGRTEWIANLDDKVLQHVWDSRRNVRVFGHNIIFPANIPDGGVEFITARRWLSQVSRLYGSSLFVFQFRNYGQNWIAHVLDLPSTLMGLG
jgi:hypothetical protein